MTLSGRAFAQVSGAIYTTRFDGTTVNANLFDDCEDVYLNGGPQNQNGPGLPPGEYYYQVTDPSGKVLLSSDDISLRRLLVNAAGHISGPIAPGHPAGLYNPANGAQGVQLWPFDETPNGGGVYKVWITKVDDYAAGEGTFGFIESKSKTDNFKCVHKNIPPESGVSLLVFKYHDWNGDGGQDAAEEAIDGFAFDVVITDAKGDTLYSGTVTTADGGYAPVEVTSLAFDQFPVSYTVKEVQKPGWTQTEPASLDGYSGTVTYEQSTEATRVLSFGNVRYYKIAGTKYHDLNGDGDRDMGEPGLKDFEFQITVDGNLVETVKSDTDGNWTSTNAYLEGVSYAVSEVQQGAPWTQTEPANNGGYVGSVGDGQNLIFGNVRYFSISGLKYWDKNGNGIREEATEPGWAGFEFTVTVNGVATTVTSGADGTWTAGPFLEGSTYSVVEVPKGAPYKQTQPADNGGYSGTLDGDVTNLVFGNARYFSISGLKYWDKNGNGSREEATEPTLEGFDFTVTVNGTSTTVTSGSDGTWSAGPFLEGSSYSVVEVQKGAPWKQTQPADNGGYSGTLGGNVSGLVFGNARYFTISGSKYYDSNANGQKDPGELAVPGINFTVTVNGTSSTVTSGSDGTWKAGPFLEGSTYSVVEGSNPGWTQTQPADNGGYSGTLGGNVSGLVFGNVKLGAGGGLTIGYWSNTNGEWAFNNQGGGLAANLARMVALNLRNANGTHFDPATYRAYKNWLLSATATNMAYMLSAQLSAMKLNVDLKPVKNRAGTVVGGVDGNALIYAPGTTSANALGFATVNAVMAEANTFLGNNGVVNDGNPLRPYAEALKNALDRANNNLNFVLPYP